jgi:hypothetical protein
MRHGRLVATAIVFALALGTAATAYGATESEHNDTLATADWASQSISLSNPGNSGQIAATNDSCDWWKFSVSQGYTYLVQVDATGTFSLDPQVEMWRASYAPWEPYRVARSDDVFWYPSHGTAARVVYSISATADDTEVYLRVSGARGTKGAYSLKVVYEAASPPAATVMRRTGADRYVVASTVNYSRFHGNYSGVTSVLVASGLDKAACDPLTATSLAGALNAPLAIINQDSSTHQLPSAMRSMFDAIKTARGNNPVKVYLIGGTTSCPSWVLARIQERFSPGQITSERISGTDRYDLAAKIAAEVRTIIPVPTYCFVANGETPAFFYDALAASPVSFHNKWPILLTKKQSVPSVTAFAAAVYGTKMIVGNDYEVAYAVETKLAEDGYVTRIGSMGWSSYRRQHVARGVAEYCYASGQIGNTAPVYANKLADALTGGTLAGSDDSPLLFTFSATELDHSTWYPYSSEWTHSRRYAIDAATVVGGTSSVSTGVFSEIRDLTGNP